MQSTNVLSLVILVGALASCFAISYDNKVALANDYTLYWALSNDTIYFKTETKATGWVGIGISEKGYMAPKSDVAVLFIAPKGNGTVFDAWTLAHAQPPFDTDLKDNTGKKGTNDWLLTSANEVGGLSTFEFNRKLNTGDSFDRIIDPTAQTKLIWAYNLDSKPYKDFWGYWKFNEHDNMDSTTIVFKK
jgi:hypothetical protein